MAAPRVSVVMPVHNEERFVEQAIGSVLAQTFHDLELIVVDDGSSDASAEILQRLAREDRRVRVVRQERSGLVQALNRGCALGDGALIARMDADDVSYPERLRRQVEQLERRPALGVIGSWVRYVDAAGAPIGEWRTPVGPSLVSWALLFGTQLAHPSVVMRRRLFERVGGYPTSSPHAEDYDLWLRAVHHAELDNVPEFLLDRRVHGDSVSDRHEAVQEQCVRALLVRAARELAGEQLDEDGAATLRSAMAGTGDGVAIEQAAAIVERLLCGYRRLHEGASGSRRVRRDAAQRLTALAATVGPSNRSLARRLRFRALLVRSGVVV